MVNIHWHGPLSIEEFNARGKQWNKLADLAKNENENLLIMGDTNTVPWSYVYQDFVEKTQLNECRNGLYIPGTYPSIFHLAGIPIDHCFFIKRRKDKQY